MYLLPQDKTESRLVASFVFLFFFFYDISISCHWIAFDRFRRMLLFFYSFFIFHILYYSFLLADLIFEKIALARRLIEDGNFASLSKAGKKEKKKETRKIRFNVNF